MSSLSGLRKAKMTITISGDVASAIDKIARKEKTPRSQIMEKMLRDSILRLRKRTIEKDIETYYLSLTEKEKKEDSEWARIAEESAKRTWND